MSSAVSRLDICTFILGNDAFGREVMQRMIARARSGVEVRLLLDGVGAIQLPNSCFTHMRVGGVQTAIFSPLLARKTQGPRNLRNHRKMVIADGATLWAGGRNLAAEYFSGAAGAPPWLDLTFDLQGRRGCAAAAAIRISTGSRPAASRASTASNRRRWAAARAAVRSAEAQFLPSGPDQTRGYGACAC